MLSPIRKLLKKFHPEGIPLPGTKLYNWVSGTDIFQRHYDLVSKDVLSYCRKGNLLDIGTGPGWLPITLSRESRDLDVTGIDVSPSMVKTARYNVYQAGMGDRVTVKEANVVEMPFPDNCFDIIVSTGTIHHWKDPIKGLNEVHRLLKNNCFALMYDIVSDTPGHILKEASQEFGKLKTLLLWLHALEEPFYTYENYGKLADNTFFKCCETKFTGVMACLILQKNISD